MTTEKFFRKSDWIACWVTFVISLIVYVLTLQPTVGLEDSGELVVASDYLGVPHPPGYPSWSLLTWLFQWVFHGVTFHGHPNPAWAVNLFSAVSGAAACGVIALLISRSGMDLLRSLAKESSLLGETTERLFCSVAGISGGLLLAFGQGMWSQSVIAEVYSLNIFFQSLVLIFLYRWVSEPDNSKWLLVCAFVFGLGITNHQTLMFMGLAIAIAVLCNDLEIFRKKHLGFTIAALIALIVAFIGVYYGSLFLQFTGVIACAVACLLIRQHLLVRDFVITGSMYVLLFGVNKWATASADYQHLAWVAGPEKTGFWLWTIFALLVPAIATFTLPRGKVVGPTFLVMFVGLAFYFYMPISSDQNPPINWGYPRTWQGFMHAITRGQYEQVKLAHVFSERFLQQVGTYLMDLRSQFYGPIALLGLVPLASYSILQQSSGRRLNFNGRIGRFEWFTWMVCWNFLFGILSIILVESDLLFLLSLLLWIAAISMPIVKRLHDLNRSGKLFWLSLIPGINGLFSIWLLFFKGTDGPNEYGDNPLSDDMTASNRNQAWLLTTLVAFLSVGVVFMILQNPKTDIQALFIGRVQYIQSHAIYVLWLGYGILLLMAFLEALVKNNPITKTVGVAMVLLLPFSLIYKNFYDKEQLKVYGGAEQNGHDFGWQFGNWQLQGVHGIEEDLRAWYSQEEFEKIWAEYPNKNYPEPMGPNAIFFGGTDPGRFVPTYMIYSAKVRQDVYLITQNALADGTYMNVMRDLYGDQIWLPSPLESNLAFQMYLKNDGQHANIEGGRVQVEGVGAVMKINGYLCKMIFDHNQYLTETKTDEETRPVGSVVVNSDPEIDPATGLPPVRTFYVEESYALPWMYPYLTPHGLIMKLNNKPTPLTEEMIKNDTDFWNWYAERLLNDNKFMRDIVARKTFSKLRSSLAGLYAQRNRPREAEAAFRQAVALYDLSPESNFRLAELIAREGRYDEAIEIFDEFLKKDPNNVQAEVVRNQLVRNQQLSQRMQILEQQQKSGRLAFNDTLELCSIYISMGRIGQADQLMIRTANDEATPPEGILQIISLAAQQKRYNVAEKALQTYTVRRPNDPAGWMNLAALQLALNKKGEMWVSIQKSIDVGGDAARNRLLQDKRFDTVRNTEQFREMVPASSGKVDIGILPGY